MVLPHSELHIILVITGKSLQFIDVEILAHHASHFSFCIHRITFQWHNWADNKAEGGLRIGLRTFAEGSVSNLTPKPVWYVWKAAGTAEEDSVFDQYKTTLGISDWDSILNTVE